MSEQRIIFADCESCFNSRPVISENGIHPVCCLSVKKAGECIGGKKVHYVGLKRRGEDG